ncbi:N-acetylmuramoyl-L-alanine amidase [Streptomyces longwoodensis]|uniref:N-acetylmuramoyl-L-alanine amidase n=1 Tax=Streptomyces longwoodensis TaxID=68231 RepID=UPI00379CAB8A
MADPLSPDAFVAALRAEGVKVAEYPGWRTRGRDSATGKPFGPVHMLLCHHTAGRDSLKAVAVDGVPGLPGPLAHIHLAKSGVATMTSASRANHAGPMALNAYASFREEHTIHPAPSKASGTIDGNDVAYGVEAENLGDGQDVWPEAQYDAYVRIAAALCRHYGWSAQSVGMHSETSIEGKVDPRGPVASYGRRARFAFTGSQFRADVAERLQHPANWSPTSPAPTTPEETKVALTEQDIKLIGRQVVTGPTGMKNPDDPTVDWALSSFVGLMFRTVRQTAADVAEIKARLDALSVGGVDLDALAERVADKLAARLAE